MSAALNCRHEVRFGRRIATPLVDAGNVIGGERRHADCGAPLFARPCLISVEHVQSGPPARFWRDVPDRLFRPLPGTEWVIERHRHQDAIRWLSRHEDEASGKMLPKQRIRMRGAERKGETSRCVAVTQKADDGYSVASRGAANIRRCQGTSSA